MKETIEAWAVISDNGKSLYLTEMRAEKMAEELCGTVVKITGEMPKKPNIEDDFVKVTVDGVDYYDSKKDCTHQEALDLAAKHGLRVLERWELYKLFDNSEAFRNSLESKWYWSASVDSNYRYRAWRLSGSYGDANNGYRYGSYGVRCVLKEARK